MTRLSRENQLRVCPKCAMFSGGRRPCFGEPHEEKDCPLRCDICEQEGYPMCIKEQEHIGKKTKIGAAEGFLEKKFACCSTCYSQISPSVECQASPFPQSHANVLRNTKRNLFQILQYMLRGRGWWEVRLRYIENGVVECCLCSVLTRCGKNLLLISGASSS